MASKMYAIRAMVARRLRRYASEAVIDFIVRKPLTRELFRELGVSG
jgi:hypothetical protein